MPETKPNYTDLVHQVVRESADPLPFAEIIRRVNALSAITTRNPKSTIRNAITQSRLIVSTGDGRYGWKYRLINDAMLRLPLSESDWTRRQLTYNEELRDALWPTFFEGQKRRDRSPVQLSLPDGKIFELTLNFLGEALWGTNATPEFWDWLTAVNARPGDDLIFRVIDGETRRYAVAFQPRAKRDEPAIAQRNQQIIQMAVARNQSSRLGVMIWDLCSYLLATGQYKHPVPPDPLEFILKDRLTNPDLPSLPNSPGWFFVKEPKIDPFITSLLDQVGKPPRGAKKGPLPTSSSPIYQLKVTLIDTQPPIWRRIQVPGDTSLPRLHAILQIAMGWTNSHLHGFRIGKHFYSEPDPDGMMEAIDERPVRLSQIASRVGSRFIYEYDFGDSWDHELVVEQILAPQLDVQYPRCLDGKRACPPEDVGGTGGYEDFLAAVRNRRHPEHAEWLTWVGGTFDPDKLDLQMINDSLRIFQTHIEKR
jgi:hypothetical protein